MRTGIETMKTNSRALPPIGVPLLLATVLTLSVLNASAQDETNTPPAAAQVAATNSTEAVIAAPAPDPAVAPAPAATNAVEIASANSGSSTNGLRLNFRNAPIDLVLNYLSDAAGFIIELDANVRGNVSVISSHPMSKDEAVDLLNSVLNRNGYAAIRTGERTLKIMDKTSAKSANNPVRIGNEPSAIPYNDEMVTQIIPIRYVEANQLVTDLSPFVSSSATIIANQAGNSIVVTDTQANIRHLVEIIKAIDSSAEDVTEVKVFKLRYADPSETATLLTSLFPDTSGTAQSPIRFGNRAGGGGFGGRGGFNPFAAAFGGGGNQGGGNSQGDRIKKRNQVVAVADARTSSVVVTATKDLMEQISEMVDQLDHPGKTQKMEVIHISNADPSEVLTVLQDTVGASTSRSTRNQSSPFQTRVQQSQSGTSSSSRTTTTGTSNNRGTTGR
jgi:type II secretory pathway component GspD/PulD (secretin)